MNFGNESPKNGRYVVCVRLVRIAVVTVFVVGTGMDIQQLVEAGCPPGKESVCPCGEEPGAVPCAMKYNIGSCFGRHGGDACKGCKEGGQDDIKPTVCNCAPGGNPCTDGSLGCSAKYANPGVCARAGDLTVTCVQTSSEETTIEPCASVKKCSGCS